MVSLWCVGLGKCGTGKVITMSRIQMGRRAIDGGVCRPTLAVESGHSSFILIAAMNGTFDVS